MSGRNSSHVSYGSYRTYVTKWDLYFCGGVHQEMLIDSFAQILIVTEIH